MKPLRAGATPATRLFSVRCVECGGDIAVDGAVVALPLGPRPRKGTVGQCAQQLEHNLLHREPWEPGMVG